MVERNTHNFNKYKNRFYYMFEKYRDFLYNRGTIYKIPKTLRFQRDVTLIIPLHDYFKYTLFKMYEELGNTKTNTINYADRNIYHEKSLGFFINKNKENEKVTVFCEYPYGDYSLLNYKFNKIITTEGTYFAINRYTTDSETLIKDIYEHYKTKRKEVKDHLDKVYDTFTTWEEINDPDNTTNTSMYLDMITIRKLLKDGFIYDFDEPEDQQFLKDDLHLKEMLPISNV